MQQTRTIEIIRANSDAIRRHGATALYVFGSRSRGNSDDESDLDVFVDYDPKQTFSLFNLVRIKRALEALTGVPTDVTTRDSLRPETRAEIEADAVRVF
ncbi:MAG: nucleotidyltransferase family protein [Hyphomicrobiaceae bacterium]